MQDLVEMPKLKSVVLKCVLACTFVALVFLPWRAKSGENLLGLSPEDVAMETRSPASYIRSMKGAVGKDTSLHDRGERDGGKNIC